MRNIIICSMLFCTLFVNAQIASFALDIAVGPTRFIFDSEDLFDFNTSAFVELGGKVYFDISDKYQLYGGLTFERRRNIFKDYSLIFLSDIDIVGNVQIQNSFYEINQDLYYATIPIKNRIKFLGEKNHLYVQAGFEFMILLLNYNRSYLYESRVKLRKIDDIEGEPFAASGFLISSDLGIGFEGALKNSVKYFIELFGGLDLIRQYKKDENTSNPRRYYLGLRLGIRFTQ